MPEPIKKSNMEIHDDHVIVRVNPKIHPLDIIYSASYILLEEAYVVIDGEPESKISVELRPKGSLSPEQLANKLNDELINYSVYKTQSEKNSQLRLAIIQRALLTNGFEDELEDFEDPEGIAIPWEEKYGKECSD